MFLAKSKKGKKNKAKNIYPHILSSRGYDKLEENMIKEKRKQREQELRDHSLSLNRSPSPPLHHDKWKRARQKLEGEFTSGATRVVAEKNCK